MNILKGNVTRYDSGTVSYAQIFNWNTGHSIAIVRPDDLGNWEYSHYTDLYFGITYIGQDCQPVTHGPYTELGKWSPSMMFNTGYIEDIGAWYEPGDISTLYKDNKLLSKVNKDGDIVGAIACKADTTGVVFAADDFTSTYEEWGGQLQENGSLKVTGPQGGSYTFSSVIGDSYTIHVTLTSISFSARIGFVWDRATHTTTPGTYSYTFTATSSSTTVVIANASYTAWGGASSYCIVKACSILNNTRNQTLTQSTASLRPIYRDDGQNKPYIEFNTGQHLQCANTTFMNRDNYIMAVGVRVIKEGYMNILSSSSATSGSGVSIVYDPYTLDVMGIGNGNYLKSDTHLPIKTSCVITSLRNSAGTVLYVNNIQQPDTTEVNNTGTINGIYIGNSTNTGLFNFYGAFICNNENDINAINKHLAIISETTTAM